jgi:cell division transport system ATP-binding protein
MIRLQDVSVAFNGHVVLDNVSLHIKRGEFTYLVGQTGAGKSTLLRLIYMDLFPQSGIVAVGEYHSEFIRKRDIPFLRRKLGIVFQDFRLLEDRNVFDNVAFALHVTGIKQKDIMPLVLRVLSDVGLSHKRNSMPNELSGGELQRVVIARALVNEPLIILADEPTGNLDPTVGLEIVKLLKQINMRGTAVLMATHDYELVLRMPERIVQIKEGKLSDVELRRNK